MNTAENGMALRDPDVPASDKAFALLGIPKRKIYADYDYLYRKHPEYFTSQEDAKSAVEYVLENPDFATSDNLPENRGLVREHSVGAEKYKHPKIKIRIVAKAGQYHVRSVHRLSDKQITQQKLRPITREDVKSTLAPTDMPEGRDQHRRAQSAYFNSIAASKGKVNRRMKRGFALLLGHPKTVWLAAAAILAASLLLATGIRWQEDILRLLPDHDPRIADYQKLVSAFDLMGLTFFDIGPAGAKPPGNAELAAVADALAVKLVAPGLFRKVSHKVDAGDAAAVLELLRRQRCFSHSPEDLAAVAEKLAPGELDQRLAGWKKNLAESPAPFMSGLLKNDPLGLAAPALERLASLRGAAQTRDGRLASADGQHLVLLARSDIPFSDSHESTRLAAQVDSLLKDLRLQHPDIKIAWFGGHRYCAANASMLQRGVALSVTVSTLAILLLTLLVYHRPYLAPLSLLPAFFGAAFALGAVRLFYSEMSAIAAGCGSLLIGISVDYGIHVLYTFDQNRPKRFTRAKLSRLLPRLFPPLLVAAGTTIAAFLTLLLSALPGYRQLGLFAALGVFGAAAFALVVLPTLIPTQRRLRELGPAIPLNTWLAKTLDAIRARPKTALGVAAVLSLLATPGISRLEFEGDVNRMNASTPALEADKAVVFASFGDPAAASAAVVSGDSQEDALAANDALATHLERLRREGTVSSYRSLAAVLPSSATQLSRRRAWLEFWDGPRLAALRRDLTAAAKRQGFNPAAFDSFLASLREDAKPLTAAGLSDGALSDAVAGMLARQGGRHYVLTEVSLPDKRQAAAFGAKLTAEFPGLIFYDGQAFAAHTVGMIHAEIKRLGLLSAGAVLLFLLFSMGGLKATLVAALPMPLSLLWTFGLMGALGAKVNFMNCVVGVFVFGLVVDYSVFPHRALRERNNALPATAGAVFVSALTTIIGLGSLALGRHPALVTLGLTAALGVASGLLAVTLVVPPLSADLRRKG